MSTLAVCEIVIQTSWLEEEVRAESVISVVVQ